MSPCPAARLRCAQSALNLRHLYYALRHLHPGHFDNEGNPGMALILDQIGLNARNMQDIILVDSALSDYTVEEVYPNPESLQELRVGIPQYPYVTAYIPKGLCVHLNARIQCWFARVSFCAVAVNVHYRWRQPVWIRGVPNGLCPVQGANGQIRGRQSSFVERRGDARRGRVANRGGFEHQRVGRSIFPAGVQWGGAQHELPRLPHVHGTGTLATKRQCPMPHRNAPRC